MSSIVYLEKEKLSADNARGRFNNELLSTLMAADDLVIEADKVSETVLGKDEIDNDLLLQDINTFLSNSEKILQKRWTEICIG
ncbi:hypothetical protein AGMMS49579_09150 [Spirochaetia bacterium]|nr:hypothetical protein AGMMS49579_09150 [Spirochaetia bacterium]